MLNADLPDNPDDSLIQPPGIKGTGRQLTVTAAQQGADKTEMSPKLSEALASSDIRLQTLEDHVSSTHALTEVQSDILGQGTVNQLSVECAAKSFPGMIGQQFTLEEFTKAPSKVNYNETIRYMSTKIGQEHLKVKETFDAFADSLAIMQTVLNELENSYLGCLLMKSDSLKEYAVDAFPLIQQNPDNNVHYFGEYVGLLEVDLTHLDFNVLQYSGNDPQGVIATLMNLSVLLAEGSLNKSVLLGALNDKTLGESLDRKTMEEYKSVPINLGDILEIICNGKLTRVFNEFTLDLPSYQVAINSLFMEAGKIRSSETSFEAVNQFILKNTIELTRVKSYYNKACSFANKSIELMVNLEMMVEYMKGDA